MAPARAARGGSSAPLGVEGALRVEALEAVAAEEVALRLHALRRVERRGAHRVIVGERAAERGHGDAVRHRERDEAPPALGARADLRGDLGVEEQVG